MAENNALFTYRTVHEANKREAFDAMRAYHNSEIAHKKDAVDILKAVLTATILVYGGLIGLVFSEKIDGCLARIISIALIVFISLFISFIVYITNKKIDKDHSRYVGYVTEYVEERKLLKLDYDLQQDGYISVWILDKYRPRKSGYHHTKNILRVFGFIIVFVAIIGSLFVYSITITQNNEGKKEILNHHGYKKHKIIRRNNEDKKEPLNHHGHKRHNIIR